MPSRATAGALAIAVLLCGCGKSQVSIATGPAVVCRVGPNGGPLVGQLADKGIGGTGTPLLADKGIGGTGIVAVISGFASICLAGQEVALPLEAPIVLGGVPGNASQLRVGQVAVIDAGDVGAGLQARRVTIRFEVSGPVDTVTSDEILVAGQRVATTVQTAGIRPAVGDWVAVSGIRHGDGVVEATLLQERPPGPVVVHGVLGRDGGAFHVGGLLLLPTPGLLPLLGESVTVSGTLLLGRLNVETIAPDLLASDPAAFFGPAIGTVLIEGYATMGDNRLRLGQGFAAPIAGLVRAGPQRGIYRFARGAAGLQAVGGAPSGGGFTPVGSVDSSRVGGFGPAPMPDRSGNAIGSGLRQSPDGRGFAPGGRSGPDTTLSGPGRGGPMRFR